MFSIWIWVAIFFVIAGASRGGRRIRPRRTGVCPSCGAETVRQARFCPRCGNTL